MLNELRTLDRSLNRFQVDVGEAHPWVKRLGKADLLIVGVDTGGLVTQVEHIPTDEAVKLFKIQESNHANFPQLNWNTPIWKIDESSAEFQKWQECPAVDVIRRIELLRGLCAAGSISGEQARGWAHMLGFCRELQVRFSGNGDSEFEAFPILLNRILNGAASAEQWIRSLTEALLASAEKSLAPIEPVELLIGGDLSKADRKAKFALMLDLADCTKFRCRVASPRMGGYFSRVLNETETGATDLGRCALTGREMPLETEKMPSPPLPLLGSTVMMSMNPQTPCQMRYGHIGTDIFPIGKSTANSLNAALVHLADASREGKNWKAVPGVSRKKKSNLLFVYLESLPEFEALIAELFAGGDASEANYEALCEEVCNALQGRDANESDLLHLFVLNKIDPGRVQVELTETFTAAQVIRGGAEWKEGARNRPFLPLKVDAFVPSPAEVMRCTQMNWERGGASYADAPGCRLANIYDVLIADRSGGEDAAKLLLRLIMQRASELLMAIGHASHRSTKDAWKVIAKEGARSAVVTASVLGITLRKLGDRKEKYMQDPAFLIGRFLSLTDTLHAQYCEAVRKGSMPPQLLGNALLPTAIGDPKKGFARMLLRVRVYQAWARGKDGTGLARWAWAEMGKIANEITDKLPDQRLSESQQAQLLLGYVARTEKASEEGARN
jgi:hypothetical protein